jgi:hypothetical protein
MFFQILLFTFDVSEEDEAKILINQQIPESLKFPRKN